MELKSTITKAKSSVDDLNSVMEGREERISGGETEQWKLPNLNGKDKIGKNTIREPQGPMEL